MVGLTHTGLHSWRVVASSLQPFSFPTKCPVTACIAELAETVLEAAACGDAMAGKIVAEAARQLAAMVSAVAARLGWHCVAVPLALAGGVLVRGPLLRGRLQDELRRWGFNSTC